MINEIDYSILLAIVLFVAMIFVYIDYISVKPTQLSEEVRALHKKYNIDENSLTTSEYSLIIYRTGTYEKALKEILLNRGL